MNNNLSDVEQRVRRYWYTDGLGELIGGGMFLLLALYFSFRQYFGDQSPMNVILRLSLIGFMIVALFFGRRLINALKTRLTYPRTGYVEYPMVDKYKRWRRILTLAIAIGIGLFLIAMLRSVSAIDPVVAVTGGLVAVILVIKQGWSSGMPRFYLLCILALVLGVALSLSGLPTGYNMALFCGLIGITFAISGGLTLWRYLKENPLPVDVEQQNG